MFKNFLIDINKIDVFRHYGVHLVKQWLIRFQQLDDMALLVIR